MEEEERRRVYAKTKHVGHAEQNCKEVEMKSQPEMEKAF